MYIPRHFRQDELPALHGLVSACPLATLVITGDRGFSANHLPLLLDPEAGAHGVLRGHVARTNPLWRDAVAGCPALAVFHGPQGYVSPGWYPSKRDDPRVVPTWNYAVVHAHGTLTAVDDPDWLYTLVTTLTDTHEQARPAPWKVTDAPAEFIDKMVGAIVGIELAIDRLEGKWKLSQNRDVVDREGVVEGLRSEQGGPTTGMAEMIEGISDDPAPPGCDRQGRP